MANIAFQVADDLRKKGYNCSVSIDYDTENAVVLTIHRTGSFRMIKVFDYETYEDVMEKLLKEER